MCGHHMFSETSVPRFVFRSGASPECTSECEKIQFHIQREEPETVMLTVDSRVFDVCVRAEKARSKQVALCFWCTVPLRTHPPMYDRRSAPSCIHLQMYVKGSVRLFSTHCETMEPATPLLRPAAKPHCGRVFSRSPQCRFLRPTQMLF